MGTFMKTSRNFRPWSSWRFRAASRAARYGDTSVTRVMTPPPLNKHASSPTRRTDSSRSAGVNPRSLLRPVRTLSPSSICTTLPCCKTSASSRARAMVDLPEPDRPVIQSVMPFWPMAPKRLSDERWQRSCEPPSAASAHSMMPGGSEARRSARYAPMSNVCGAARDASSERSFPFSSKSAENASSDAPGRGPAVAAAASWPRSLEFSANSVENAESVEPRSAGAGGAYDVAYDGGAATAATELVSALRGASAAASTTLIAAPIIVDLKASPMPTSVSHS
mmetsp:Transcript_12420/g.38281  ORF Transcript_12420/g.38281 Transcript_12420/m.38281 type:complete len:280 (+) Transcript_12420:2392-3231(+)